MIQARPSPQRGCGLVLVATTLIVATLGALGCQDGEPYEVEGTDRGALDAVDTAADPQPADAPSSPAALSLDTDGDGKVSRSELSQGLSEQGVFAGADTNGNEELSAVEYEHALYLAWDLNGDQRIDVYEYEDGSAAYFPEADAFGTFEDHDDDGDAELNILEFHQPAVAAFDDADENGDGRVVDRELSTWLFDGWDLNGDGVVDHREYRWEQR